MSEVDLKNYNVEVEYNERAKRVELKIYEKDTKLAPGGLIGVIYKAKTDQAVSSKICWKVYGDDESVEHFNAKSAVLSVIALDKRVKEDVSELKKLMNLGD